MLSCQLQSTGLHSRDQVPRAKGWNEVPRVCARAPLL